MKKSKLKVIKNVAAEPSSWAGAAAVVQAVSLVFPQYGAAIGVLTALLGAVAVAKREAGAQGGRDESGT